MTILVLNSGSSSVKYRMFDPGKKQLLAKGVVERIGMAGAMLTHKPFDREEIRLSGEILDHKVAIEYILSILLSKNHGVIKDKSEIAAVGHRVVHGGETFSESELITSEVIKEIARCMDYAPLHNPLNLKGIRATQAFYLMSLRLQYLIRLSIRQCPVTHICTVYHMFYIKDMVFDDTDFMVHPICLYLKDCQN